MGAYLFSITSQNFTCKLNGEKVHVHKAKFRCRSSAEGFEDTQARLERGLPKSEYFILDHGSNDRFGCVVYDGRGVTCFVDDYHLDKTIKPVGIILGTKGKYYIETDVMLLERLRRENEVSNMDSGSLFIGRFGRDTKLYLQFLESQGPDFNRGYAPIL